MSIFLNFLSFSYYSSFLLPLPVFLSLLLPRPFLNATLSPTQNICAFIISACSYNYLRLNKPFNPMLGETFELFLPETETRIVLEQVSHHPPISVWHAESPHFVFRGSMNPKLRFWGKSIEVKPEGDLTVELKSTGEVFTWKSISCCVHNIIVGRIWFEQVSKNNQNSSSFF